MTFEKFDFLLRIKGARLGLNQALALIYMNAAGRSTTMDLARAMRVSRHTASNLCKLLCTRKFLQRITPATRGGNVFYAITNKGHNSVKEITQEPS